MKTEDRARNDRKPRFDFSEMCRSKIEGNVAVRASMEEIQALGPERAKAFMEGIAEVIAANSGRRKP